MSKDNEEDNKEKKNEDVKVVYKEFDLEIWLRRPRTTPIIIKMMKTLFGNCLSNTLQIRGGYLCLGVTNIGNFLSRGNILAMVPDYQVSITFHVSDLKEDARLAFFQAIVKGGFREGTYQIKLLVPGSDNIHTDGGKLIVLENTDLASILFSFNVDSNYQKGKINQLAVNLHMFEVE